MNIHFFNSFKYPDSEQSYCNHDEGSHYSTPHFIYWSSSADITTYRASKLSAILRDATPGLTYSIERWTTITSLKLSGSALETDSVADDDAAASIPP